MRDLFMFIIVNIQKFGAIAKANYYGHDFASVEFETQEGRYSINISFEKKKEEVTENV